MAETKQDLRDIEAFWLRELMNRRGLSHTELHEQLTKVGFAGQLNNVTMWTTARTTIPNEWLGRLIQILNPADADADSLTINMYSRRMPYLRPYFKRARPSSAPEHTKDHSLKNSLDASDQDIRSPKHIFYIAKHGNRKGERFVPHCNRKGKYQGGISRFGRDAEEFNSIQDLWIRLRSDPDFKVRMSPEDRPGPPSLISRDSLVFEWEA